MAATTLQLRADAPKVQSPCRKLPIMLMKKLLATLASIALTSGALLGVSAPAFADDAAVPASAPDVSIADGESETPASPPAPQSTSLVEVEAIAKPVVPKPAPAPTKVAPVPNAAAAVVDEPASEETAAPSSQSRANNNDDKKVWVCKFVSSDNSPSGYRLKEGKQPIHVSINALGDDVNETGNFADNQPSFVVEEDDESLCSRTEVTVDEEVQCPTYQYGGLVSIATATKLFYGTVQVDFTFTQTTRALTAEEIRACDPPEEVFVCQFEASKNHPSGWVLKSGVQPVLMLSTDLGDSVNTTGDYDVTTPSFIVTSNDSSLCSSEKVERSTEVTCPTFDSQGYATITTVNTFFYGSVSVKQSTEITERALKDGELSYCPDVELLEATAEAILLDAGCNAGQQLILGPIANATWGEVTDPEGPLDYSVTATANPGAQFVTVAPGLRVALAATGSTTLTFTGTLQPQLDPSDPECNLDTLGLVMPAVSFTQTSCTVAGSYRLGVAPGYDPAHVTFTVNGVSGVVAGTYSADGPGPVTVTAQVVAPNGLEFDWVDPPTFTFVTPADTVCDPGLPTLALPTLAFTGSGGSGGLWWLMPSGMILLGAAAIYVRRRMDAVS